MQFKGSLLPDALRSHLSERLTEDNGGTDMNNTLIVYYSLFRYTRNLAYEIAIQVRGILRELIPDKNYPSDYNTAVKEAKSQISRGFYPELISGNEPIYDYQIIFIGSPNWFGTVAPPVISFLRKHDFTGKTIIPFCTHGGGGFGNIEKDIAKECPKSVVLPGIAISGAVKPEEVAKWLKTIL